MDTKLSNVYTTPEYFSRQVLKNALNNGRPKNGMFIAVPKKFKGCAKEMPTKSLEVIGCNVNYS